jgi:uroporphyrinogen III methyltransferase/synthase
VLVAGSPATSERLRARLAALGAHVFLEPAIRITDPPDWAPVDAALDGLEQYDWLTFSSANGVDYFFRRLTQQGGDARRLGHLKLAAVGSATAERLLQYNLQADVVPEQFDAESLARTLVGEAAGRRFLLTGTDRGRPVLGAALERLGAHVDEIIVYGSVDVDEANPEVAMALSCGEIHWITFTSGTTARSLVRLYGDALRSARFASISPLTTAALREMGHEPAAEASPHTTAALVDAILHQTNAIPVHAEDHEITQSEED